MKKRLLSLMLALLLVLPAPALAGETVTADTAAQRLSGLSLFRGSDKGFELERAPSRQEALIMLIRLLGEDEAASAYTGSSSFTDLTGWSGGWRYIAYGEAMGYTKGYGNDVYGRPIFSQGMESSQAMFLTFVLRSLGYHDEAGDFFWQDAAVLAEKLGLLRYGGTEEPFTRGGAALISLSALSVGMKGSTETLGAHLVKKGVFTQTQLTAALAGLPAGTLPGAAAQDVTAACGAVSGVFSAKGEILTITLSPGGSKAQFLAVFRRLLICCPRRVTITGNTAGVSGWITEYDAGSRDITAGSISDRDCTLNYTDGAMAYAASRGWRTDPTAGQSAALSTAQALLKEWGTAELTQEETLRVIHDGLLRRVTLDYYGLGSSNSACGALNEGYASQAGVTDAMLLLCRLAGLDAQRAVQNRDQWLMTRMDGVWRHTDAAADKALSAGQSGYTWFMLDDEAMLRLRGFKTPEFLTLLPD